MKTFEYKIADPAGMHARPAGMFAAYAKTFASSVTVEHDGKSADARRLLSLMTLGAKQGSVLKIKVEGPDEEEAASAIATFLGRGMGAESSSGTAAESKAKYDTEPEEETECEECRIDFSGNGEKNCKIKSSKESE